MDRSIQFLLHQGKVSEVTCRMSDFVLILDAASFAADRHRHQRRKDADASPYINHPLALADVLAREGGVDDATVLAAALLHDTIEDTKTTFEDVRNRFGHRVAEIVLEVTNDASLSKEEQKRQQVIKSASKSNEAKQVKLADKICNLRDILATPPAHWTVERKREYFIHGWQVVEGLRGVNARLEAAFDEVYNRGMSELP